MKKLRLFAICLLIAIFAINFAACQPVILDEDFVDNDEFYTIKMYMPFNMADLPMDLKKVNNELNKILREEINAEVEITGYNISEYPGRVNAAVASNIKFDLLWTDFESYYRLMEMKALYPIDSILERYGQQVKEDLREEFWEQVKGLDGKIYAAPNIQILPRGAGVIADEETFRAFMDHYDLTEEIIIDMPLAGDSTDWGKLDVIENYLLYVRNQGIGKGGITWGVELPYFLEGFCGFDTLCTGVSTPGIIRSDATGQLVVENQYETDEFKAIIDYLKRWYQNGLIPTDVGQASYSISNLDLAFQRTWKPDNRSSYMIGGVERYRYTFQMGKMYYLQSYILGTMWSISATSENPARSMKFLNLLHSDPRVHNLLKLGIEGVHYELVNDGKQAKQLTASVRYNNENTRWVLGNELIGLPLSIQSEDVFIKTQEINDSTPTPDIIGFRFDRSSVMTEIQLCAGVFSKYGIMGYGKIQSTDSQYYNKFLADLETAGANKIIQEKQRQLDAWLAQKSNNN